MVLTVGVSFSTVEIQISDRLSLPVRTRNNVEVWECDQNPPQQWNFTYGGFISLVHNRGSSTNPSTLTILMIIMSNTLNLGLCMEVPNSNNGAQVETYPCNGGLNQKWHFDFPN